MKLKTKTTDILVKTVLYEIYKLRELTEIAPDSKYYKNRLKETEEAYNELLTYKLYN